MASCPTILGPPLGIMERGIRIQQLLRTARAPLDMRAVTVHSQR
jgi:hypothetical protein